MQEEQKQEPLGSWSLPAHPEGVAYSTQLIEELAATGRNGYSKFPRGGVEIGGVLYGTRDKEAVRVLAARPFSCQYTFGPSFSLSPDEHDVFAAALKNYKKDPELKELTPIGWYHSHTRNDLALSDADLHLHNRHFPEPWQIALLFKPETGKTTSLGIFVRSGQGDLPAKPSLTVQVQDGNVDGPEAQAEEGNSEPAAPKQGGEPKASLPEWLREPAPKPRLNFGRYVKAAGMAAGAIGLAALLVFTLGNPVRYWTRGMSYWTRVANYWGELLDFGGPAAANLRVEGTGEALTIRWDATAEPLLRMRKAALTIWDGDRKSEVILDRTALLQGSTQYRRTSDSVSIRLTAAVQGRNPLVETARFVGRLPQPGSEPAGEAGKGIEALRSEREQLEIALRLQTRENDVLAERLSSLEQLAAVQPPVAQARVPDPVAREPEPEPETPPVTAPPVILEQRPETAPSAPGTSDAGPARSSPSYGGPASGMLIWSGVLTNGSVLTIQGRQASAGTVSGRFPGKPVRVTVYAAELSSGGLVVFTTDQKHAGAGVKEAPTAQNAWTQTTYRYAPERARTVEIVQRPGQDNNWVFVAVRATGQTLSNVVVSWEVIR